MLMAEEARISWLGIDMRARWRRRVVVLGTYCVAFAACVWLEAWRGWSWATPVKGLFALVFAIEFLSVFREGMLLKSFEVRRQPYKDRMGGRVGMRVRRALSHLKLESSSKFQRMSANEQADELKGIERLVEQSFPFEISEDGLPDAPDERERTERSEASRRTLKFLAWLMTIVAVNEAINGHGWSVVQVVGMLLMIMVIARTGPKAVVLWTEADPREVGGEMELVEKEA